MQNKQLNPCNKHNENTANPPKIKYKINLGVCVYIYIYICIKILGLGTLSR